MVDINKLPAGLAKEYLLKGEKALIIKDHRGRVFPNQREMCKFHGVNYNTFIQRRYEYGYSLEKSLSKESLSSTKVRDHSGNVFNSIREMCRAYNISAATYHTRIRQGKSMQEALETPVKKRK